MKSSTMHRSNLSRERIAVLEQLLSQRNKSMENTRNIDMRSDKDRELDLLWQKGHKSSQRQDRATGVYLTIGFITGAICILLLTSILNFGNKTEATEDLTIWKKGNNATVKVLPSEGIETGEIKTEKYTVKNGDTLQKISYRYYGTYDPSKIEQIQEINNINNPNGLQIGQNIIIPIE